MIGIDTNVLIDLLVSSKEDHEKTITKLKTIKDSIATCSINIGEVLRLLTHPRVFSKPMNMLRAIHLVESWVLAYNVEILNLPEDFLSRLKTIAETEIQDLRGNEVFDAKIAMTLQYHGVSMIWTRDSDFKKYSFLEVLS